MQPEVCETSRVGMTPDAENTALLVNVFEFSSQAKAPSKTVETGNPLPHTLSSAGYITGLPMPMRRAHVPSLPNYLIFQS
jgi:hypothetical protein